MFNIQTARTIEGESVEVHNGLVGAIRANNAALHVGSAGAVIARESAEMTMSGAQLILIGQDANINRGGGQYMLVGGQATLQQSGAGVLAAGQATVRQSLIGFLLAGNVDLGEDTRVLFTTTQAIAFGIAAGLVVTLGRLLFRPGRPAASNDEA